MVGQISSKMSSESKMGMNARSTAAPAGSASARNSRSFPGFEEATYNRRVLPCACTEIGLNELGLKLSHATDSGRREPQQILHLGAAKRLPFGRGLDFHKFPAPGHHHVHVDLGAGIFFVG